MIAKLHMKYGKYVMLAHQTKKWLTSEDCLVIKIYSYALIADRHILKTEDENVRLFNLPCTF